MYYDKSSTKVEAVVKVNGTKGTHIFESLGCLYRFLNQPDTEADLLKVSVLDYTSFGAEKERMLDGKTAFYLFGTKPLGGSMEPYVAAFADERAAQAAQSSLEGKVRTWDELQENLERAQRKADKKKEGK
jgi:nitrous oxide reductase accessory protein NosL